MRRQSHPKRDGRASLPSTLEGKVRDITHAGESVVETDQGIVLAHRAGFPGERVRVRITDKRQGVLHGALAGLLEPSPARREPECALADRCGGCPLMGLSHEAQAALKLERVERAVTGVCEPDVHARWEPFGEALGYRRRMRLAFRRVGSGLVLGYHVAGSRTLIDVPTCVVLEPSLSAAQALARELLSSCLAGAGEIELIATQDGAVVRIEASDAQSPDTYRAAEALASRPGISGVALRIGTSAPANFGTPVQSSLGPDGIALRAPTGAFTQANTQINSRLVERVVELAEPAGKRVVELFAGHGNFTVALAPLAASLCAVEGDAAAADACRENLRARGHDAKHGTRVIAADANDISVRSGPADVIVLDPPRAGAKALAQIVAQKKPERVVYVSCHMTTLARDLRALAELGYRADAVSALDMFPHTAHVEAVVRLRAPR